MTKTTYQPRFYIYVVKITEWYISEGGHGHKLTPNLNTPRQFESKLKRKGEKLDKKRNRGTTSWIKKNTIWTLVTTSIYTQLKPRTNPLRRLISPKRYLTTVTSICQITSCRTEINRQNMIFMPRQCALPGAVVQIPDTHMVIRARNNPLTTKRDGNGPDTIL